MPKVAEQGAPSRRHIKVGGGNLGPFLCWAVVFADIGTSVYYTPGILYGHFTTRSAIFVLITLAVFVLLCVKYAEVTWRYPEGGGVVNVSSQALHPFAGLVGGLLILVDYFLTAGLSALSGLIYLSVVAPEFGPIAVELSVAALVGLGLLNVLGVRQSARTTAIFAIAAGAGQLVVVVATAAYLGPAGIVHSFHAVAAGPPLSFATVIRGYGAAFLAFSGLESIAQLAPSMREPRRTVAYRSMGMVVLTMAVTSPLLTLWSTTLLTGGVDPSQFISLLGTHVAGRLVGDYVAISGAILLVFAGNTAIIGAYHVFIALARMGFLPRALEGRNRWRQTPHWAIGLAVLVPITVLVAVHGSVDRLGDLYAFGLLGSFVLTCLSLDVVRWRERLQWNAGRIALFAAGVVTTVLVVVAWTVNLFEKPAATEFGGVLTLTGLVVGLATYRYSRSRRPAVFPVPYRPQRARESIAHALRARPAEGDVLIILPHEQASAEAVIAEGIRVAAGRGAVFLYRGTRYPHQHHELLEVNDPWLKDYSAQDALARAEMMTRRSIPRRRFVYVPGSLAREIVREVWVTIHPRETVVTEEDEDMLPPAAVDRVHVRESDGTTVLHLFTKKLEPEPGRPTAR